MSMLMAFTPRPLRQAALGVLLAAATALGAPQAHAQTMDRTGTQWAPYLEWSLDNPSFSGNPFDLVATATFTHSASGETRTTEMFYNGGTEWKFRFTGTRTGEWTFTTTSNDSDLANHSGTVTIGENPNAEIGGFLTSSGNKFARPYGPSGELRGILFNLYQDNERFLLAPDAVYNSTNPELLFDTAITEIKSHGGMATYSSSIGNRWFSLPHLSYTEHSSVNPDFRTFEALERTITYLHRHGIHFHIWAWGDESRRWTPIGGVVGGINGRVDRRLQRYIAARLGPLPGWSMGYGFDLDEWISVPELDSWMSYLEDRMGWPHLLAGRRNNDALVPNAGIHAHGDPSFPFHDYSDAVSTLDLDPTTPHLFAERDAYLRTPSHTMDNTRRNYWRYAMAGGMGGWWGAQRSSPHSRYPNPEQLVTHKRFWDSRFLLSFTRANSLSNNALVLAAGNTHFVFYAEASSSVHMNLSTMSKGQAAVAVDTKSSYTEISIGTLEPGTHTWAAPYTSDWAIAVGDYASTGENAHTPLTPPETPTGEQIIFE